MSFKMDLRMIVIGLINNEIDIGGFFVIQRGLLDVFTLL
jgi:hypothetical protein